MEDRKPCEAALHIRAVYLWERDGRPEGGMAKYLLKAQAMLDEEASIAVPIDEATAARGLLTRDAHEQDNSRLTTKTK
jgi:hypothetical protein